MGYMRHHAIVVTSWDVELLTAAHAKAVELGDRHPNSLFETRLFAVTEITPDGINGYRSFLVAPDGSKEGWEASEAGDAARAALIEWLNEQRYEDRSSSLDWVEVQYGDDDLQTRIVNDSDEMTRTNPWTDEEDDAWAAEHPSSKNQT